MKSVINIGTLLRVTEILISEEDEKVNVAISVSKDNEKSTMRFYNVSNFKMGYFTYPMVIDSMEIFDHKEDGWSKEQRFEIRDYEEGSLGFCCENYKL
ncbi:MAG: hypothetical protein IKV30_07655 [Clostridia bacterium]|nr:hypothetical protein [Clostridia bacterium]